MEEKEINDKYVKFRKDMYEGVVTGVRTSKRYGGVNFPLIVGLHRGSSLRHYLFTLVINELTNIILCEVLHHLLMKLC